MTKRPVGIDVVLHATRPKFLRDSRFNHVGQNRLLELRRGDRIRVLRRHDDGIDRHRPVAFVDDRHLRLAVRPEPREVACLAAVGQCARQPMRKEDRHRHELIGLVRRVAEHHSLVAGSAGIDPHRNVAAIGDRCC